ncbi:uncharacterized protein LOC117738653 [Cyclopterus lumpus]|uniref:uncharacterized protein LOC117738653 n=1 Tax=Cyclopterus lumpus TaxID=8103 RepID=UPI001486BFBF|nr:uncharacterized protein LOC117738653 [Cyclopterus lumpus]
MDFPVEATVLLGVFPNQAAVRGVLRSHGLALTDVDGDQVRVKGFFRDLKAAKASLEPLLGSQTSSAGPKNSSGAVSKRPGGNSAVTDVGRGRDKPPSSPNHASPPPWAPPPNRHPSSQESRASFSPPPGQCGSFGPGRESFVVETDVLRYAEQLRMKDINSIMTSHDVKMERREVGESCVIILLGKSARVAAGKLQSLMDDLSKSLRTQEVPLKDMDRDGHALWKRIRYERSIYQSVLVRPMADKLHLIGPSAASYELKQRLLGGSVGRTGRTSEKNSKRRSSSLPPIRRKERDGGATARPSPVGAAGFGQGGAVRGRSPSHSQKNTRAESVYVQETEDKRPSKTILNFIKEKQMHIQKKIQKKKD